MHALSARKKAVRIEKEIGWRPAEGMEPLDALDGLTYVRLASRADTASVKVAVCALNVLFARSLSPPVPGVPSETDHHNSRIIANE